MTQALEFFIDMWRKLFAFLENRVVFNMFGFQVSWAGLIFAGFVIFFVVVIFWKGAKA